MSPAELVRETRLRRGISQRSLALRAGTSQSAISRIEQGDEELTWPRFRALMVSMGEEPTVSSQPLKSRYDAWGMQAQRAMGKRSGLIGGLNFNKFISELTVKVRAKKLERAG